MSIYIDDLRSIASSTGLGVIDLAADEIERLERELAAAKATGCPNCGDSAEHEWVLITPEGKRYTGETKLKCMFAHTKATTPESVIVARILDGGEAK
jgi:hypothetical protein